MRGLRTSGDECKTGEMRQQKNQQKKLPASLPDRNGDLDGSWFSG
jgi:hypothetical protein